MVAHDTNANGCGSGRACVRTTMDADGCGLGQGRTRKDAGTVAEFTSSVGADRSKLYALPFLFLSRGSVLRREAGLFTSTSTSEVNSSNVASPTAFLDRPDGVGV